MSQESELHRLVSSYEPDLDDQEDKTEGRLFDNFSLIW